MDNTLKLFALPLLINDKLLYDITEECYYVDENLKEHNYGLLCSFSNEKDVTPINFILYGVSQDLMIYKCNVINKYLFSLNVPEQYEKDFELIREGKYSDLSTKAMERIIEFTPLEQRDYIKKVFRKDDSLRVELYKKICATNTNGKLVEDKSLLKQMRKDNSEVEFKPQNCTIKLQSDVETKKY